MTEFSNHDLSVSKWGLLSEANQYPSSINNESFVLIGGSWLGMRRLEDSESQILNSGPVFFAVCVGQKRHQWFVAEKSQASDMVLQGLV